MTENTSSEILRLEYKTKGSSKFWEPYVEGDALTVRFGKIGTDGQTRMKKFSSPEKAEAEYRKLVCEKLAKGYKPTAETVAILLQKTAPATNPAAISSLFIGELVPNEIIKDICGWLTACIQHGMTPKQFKRVWNIFLEEEDEELEEALGRTSAIVEKTESEFWKDRTVGEADDLDELYAKAVENGGDRFVWYDNNAYIDIVALRGDPGAQSIQLCVLHEENCKDKKGRWFSKWPNKLGPGAPIASLNSDGATLRDGKNVSAR